MLTKVKSMDEEILGMLRVTIEGVTSFCDPIVRCCARDMCLLELICFHNNGYCCLENNRNKV